MFAKFQFGFCLANHGLAPLLTFTMQNHPPQLGQIGTSIQKVTEPIFQFLGAHAPQPPVLLRQGVPPRDTTLGQLTLATHWPVNSLMQVDQPGWHLAKIQFAFCLANHGLAPLLTFTMQKHPPQLGQIGTSIQKVTEPKLQFLVLMALNHQSCLGKG